MGCIFFFLVDVINLLCYSFTYKMAVHEPSQQSTEIH